MSLNMYQTVNTGWRAALQPVFTVEASKKKCKPTNPTFAEGIPSDGLLDSYFVPLVGCVGLF